MKLIIIGIDGTCKEILFDLKDRYNLPNISELLNKGVWAELESTFNMSSPSAWTSITTGVNPGKHGIFFFTEVSTDGYYFIPIDSRKRKAKTIWQICTDFGRRCIIVNVPLSYPADRINGVMVTGLRTPGLDSPGSTFPEYLAEDLKKRNYIIMSDAAKLYHEGNIKGSLDELIKQIRSRVRTIKFLMKKEKWDLLFAVFSATDIAHHIYWRYYDSNHPHYNPEYKDYMGIVYEELDRGLGEILNLVEDNYNLMVLSDHGAGLQPGGAVYLNDWLAHEGFLRYLSKKDRAVKVKSIFKKFTYDLLRQILPKSTRENLQRFFPQARTRYLSSIKFENIDWARTIAYSDNATNVIRLNIRGREPNGIIHPAQQREICEKIIQKLYMLRDPVSGNKVIKYARNKYDIYFGNYMDMAPDIEIQWSAQGTISGLYPGQEKKLIYKNKKISGGHKQNGIIIASGPNFKKCRQEKKQHIYDVTPTVLPLLNIPLSRNFDGKPILEFFSKLPAIKYIKNYSEIEETKTSEYSEIIRNRLKGLGYINF